jgi:Protein of unknown function (DUF402)
MFLHGEAITLRELWHGRVFEARPMIVVQDDPDQAMFFLPGGIRCGLPIGEDGSVLRLSDRPWHLEVRPRGDQPILSFAWPDIPYSVLLWAAEDRRCVWYVNLEDPLERTPIGFDTVDHALDVLIELDRSSWRWKDEEKEAVRDGFVLGGGGGRLPRLGHTSGRAHHLEGASLRPGLGGLEARSRLARARAAGGLGRRPLTRPRSILTGSSTLLMHASSSRTPGPRLNPTRAARWLESGSRRVDARPRG